MFKIKDVIIIGKGPAGISAALYLKRAGLNILVIGKDNGALDRSEKIENFYGQTRPIQGRKLIEIGIKQAQDLGIEVITEEVVSIVKDDAFSVKTNKNEYTSKIILLATGKERNKLKIKGMSELEGKGVSFCAICDGFFYRNKAIAVIGNGDYAISELHDLLNFSKDITLYTNGLKSYIPTVPEHVKIVTDEIIEIIGKEKVEAIKTNENTYNTDGIFVAMGSASALDFAKKIGISTQNNSIVVDKDFCTNVTGFFAAGDAIGGFLQIAKAVSDGANASKSIIKYSKN